MNATTEFDGVVEEICELLVSEKVHTWRSFLSFEMRS